MMDRCGGALILILSLMEKGVLAAAARYLRTISVILVQRIQGTGWIGQEL